MTVQNRPADAAGAPQNVIEQALARSWCAVDPAAEGEQKSVALALANRATTNCQPQKRRPRKGGDDVLTAMRS